MPFGDWLLPMLGAGSCLFLMYYLPPASWWRFIGWLVLGLSIYTAYGYTRSTIGQAQGRPARTPLPLKLASVGFLATAVGLFVIPHDAGLGTLFHQAADAGIPEHGRSLLGLGLIAIGLVFGDRRLDGGSKAGGGRPRGPVEPRRGPGILRAAARVLVSGARNRDRSSCDLSLPPSSERR